MNSINNNKKYPKKGFRDDFFSFNMGIKDDIFDPFKDDLLGLKSFEDRIFRHFSDIFSPLESLNEKENKNEAEEKPKEIKEVEPPKEIEEKEKEDEIKTDTKKEIKQKEQDINTNTNTNNEFDINTDIKGEDLKDEPNEKTKEENNDLSYISKEYTCSYKNLNGKEESYTSQAIKQSNNGHSISEIKENYKNSNGICKSAYQRGLDDKTTRFIKEKNIKTGEHNQKKVIKGLEENEINDFNKAYYIYCKKCGFNNCFDINVFDPFGIRKNHSSNNLLF